MVSFDFLKSFLQLQLEKAELAFDKVFKLKPNAYLWQAGIVKFYLGKINEAGNLFVASAKTYEGKFGSIASEERVWRDACQTSLWMGNLNSPQAVSQRKKDPSYLVPKCPVVDTSDPFMIEARKEIRLAQQLFSSTLESDVPKTLISRAALKSLGGAWEKQPKMDVKGWRLTSWFYLGLYYDCIGQVEESKRCMKMALHLARGRGGRSSDLLQTLPLLHMSVRDWFDDDDVDLDPMSKEIGAEDVEFSPKKPDESVASMAYADPIIEDSIRRGVAKLRLTEVKEALRRRGLPSKGTKSVLQEKLFYSLMDDSGLCSGFAP